VSESLPKLCLQGIVIAAQNVGIGIEVGRNIGIRYACIDRLEVGIGGARDTRTAAPLVCPEA
jgi:hypothetical protein